MRDLRVASDALLAKLVAKLVPVVLDAGADGARVFYVSPDHPAVKAKKGAA